MQRASYASVELSILGVKLNLVLVMAYSMGVFRSLGLN